MRIPRGVRAGGRGVGGRFASVDDVFSLYSIADDGESRAALYALLVRAAKRDPLARVYADMVGSLFRAPRKKKGGQKAATRKKSTAKKKTRRGVTTAPKAKKVSRPKRAPGTRPGVVTSPAEVVPVRYPEFLDIAQLGPSVEWEINFDYIAKSSNTVHVTFRFRRADGRVIHWPEAVRVFAELLHALESLRLPDWGGRYLIAHVEWYTPRRASKRFGDENDLAMFIHPMHRRISDTSAWRLAAVKVDTSIPF